MTLQLGMVTTDTNDAMALATWWAEQTGAEIAETNDGWYVMVRGGSLPVVLAFQRVDAVTPGKNRLHLDLTADDLESETERLLAAGARRTAAFLDPDRRITRRRGSPRRRARP